MDVVELSAVVTMAFAVGIGAQHLWDRYAPNGLYRRTERRAATIPQDIGAQVKIALNEAAAQQMALAEEAEKAMATSAQMSMVRSVGVDKIQQQAMSNMLANGMLENILPVLRVVVPGIADQLEENPQLIFTLIENPFFKKYVLPRIQSYLPQEGASPNYGSGASPGSGWGP